MSIQMMNGHILYRADDFTHEEIERKNKLAVAVIEGGLSVCKRCGAVESDVFDFGTCKEYTDHKRKENESPNP